jgi:hypothetical protein
MNFQSVAAWAAGIAIAAATVGKLDDLQRWVWIAEAKVIAESRTSHWGSPRFFKPKREVDAVPKQTGSGSSSSQRED